MTGDVASIPESKNLRVFTFPKSDNHNEGSYTTSQVC